MFTVLSCLIQMEYMFLRQKPLLGNFNLFFGVHTKLNKCCKDVYLFNWQACAQEAVKEHE